MRLQGRLLIAAAAAVLLCCGPASARSGNGHGSGYHAAHWSHFHSDPHGGHGHGHSSHRHADKRHDRHAHDHASHDHRHDLQNGGGDGDHAGGADHANASWYPEGNSVHRANPGRHSGGALRFRETTTKSGAYRREWSTGPD